MRFFIPAGWKVLVLEDDGDRIVWFSERMPNAMFAETAEEALALLQADKFAVLPLANGSPDPEADYFSDGITESIISSLSQLPGLRVMARSTVFRYKGREVDSQVVGRELNVRAVVSGRILPRGDSVILGLELVDVEDGAHDALSSRES